MNLYVLSGMFLVIMSLLAFIVSLNFNNYSMVYLMDWEVISINSSSLVFTMLFDWMSLMFMLGVLLISSMVIFCSSSYVCADKYNIRFLFVVSLFILSMLLMIISPKLISSLLGRDSLGLVSYALVIYFNNYNSYSAGMLTILTNRLSDVAILISIFWMMNYGSLSFIYYVVFWDASMYHIIMLVVLASFTKSAQIPFSSWLPAAMAAPTPVSALVNSSTLVTAGVLIRFSDVFMNMNCGFFSLLSMMTMFMSGVEACFEHDLKKIIALSTLSQLGLMMSIMFMSFSVLSFFHLLVHAFF